MAAATAEPRRAAGCGRAWGLLLGYALLVAFLAALMAAVSAHWIPLTHWKIFRRCVSIAAMLALLWFASREGVSWREFGFGKDRWHLGVGVALGIAAISVMAMLGLALRCYTVEITPDRARLWQLLLLLVPAALLIGFLEEVIFRGFILRRMLSCSRATAVLVSSSVYSLVHVRATEVSGFVAMEMGGLFLLGLVLAGAYLKTGQLYLSIGLHAALAYAARINKLLMTIDLNHWWLGGSSRLVNGLLGWAVLLLIGAVVWRWPAAPPESGGARHAR